MARQPDPDLEDRILSAARRLWKKGAEKSLTMRAVARAARTNTPAVYRRFRRREDILRALLELTRHEMFQTLEAASSVEEACDRYLDFAVSNSHEYELYYRHEYDLLFSAKPSVGATLEQILKRKRPALELMKKKMAAQLGGFPDDYTRLTLSVWTVLHGTALLLIAHAIQQQHAKEMRSISRESIAALLSAASRFTA
jgi:AcrR family transcriptional regulator